MSRTPPPPPPSQPPPLGPSPKPSTDATNIPWWKRWWAIGIAIIAVLGVLGSIGESDDDSAADGEGAVASAEAAGATADAASAPATSPSSPTEAPTTSEPSPTPEPEPVAVPEVIGLSEAEAVEAVEAAGLRPRVDEQEVSALDDQGVVLEQRPPTGRELEPGATVTVVVGGEFVWADVITYEGSGDDVVDVQVPEDQLAIARIRHDGGGNFAIWSYDEHGNQVDLLVNDIGTYAGVRLVNLETAVRQLEVTAGGPWTVELAPLGQARRFAPDGSIDGTGDDVVLADASTVDGSRATLSHTGEGNFAIWAYAERSTDLLVNDIGTYEGTVRWPGGTVVLDVTAGGPWTITLE